MNRHRVFASAGEMLAGATWRAPMDKTDDSLSGSPFERVIIDGQSYVVKYVGRSVDWLARALGDDDCFVRTLWSHGLLDELPPEIDTTIEAVAGEGDRVALLLRDVGPHLVPSGPVALEQHRRFLAHMAKMHAHFWGFSDDLGLLPPGNRYTCLGPATGARELDDPVPRLLESGWAALEKAAPAAYRKAIALAEDPAPLVKALAETPSTFIHGDWKFGNLGSHPDGRTILLDWGWPGRAAPLVDMGWYLSVNCDRLPESKEASLAGYRAELTRSGVDTESWWDRQLELAMLGAFVQMGWSKTHDPVELAWWTDRITLVEL
jgi:hypothetical protein